MTYDDPTGQWLCGHYCGRYSVRVVGLLDLPNTLGKTHDCCGRHGCAR